MAIYKMVGDKESLEQIPATSFGKEGVFERTDLQRILRDQPDVLEEGLFIITEEFSNWEGSGRSIDLLAIDQIGRLVVIELKRGETGEHMDLQAIRYAAMVSTITLPQCIEAHQAYLNKLGLEEENAEERISDHLQNNKDVRFDTVNPRIILASEGFSPELTTCALWLNDTGLDVTCIRMQPHRSGSELLIETSQIIPLPEAQNYLVRVKERQEDVKREQSSRAFVPGEAFAEQIEKAQESIRPSLKKMYGWAVGLEQEDLAVVYTHRQGENLNLQVALNTGHSPALVAVNIHDLSVRLRPRHWKRYCPDSVPQVDAFVGQRLSRRNSSFNISLKAVNDELLAALTEAYREANGLLASEDSPEA